jgi:putative ABC transport system permease protein
MNFRSVLKLSTNNLRANPLRSFLTMLGLIIGIGSVILIVSVGAGAQSLILSQVNKIGSNLIGILPGASDAKGPPASVFGIQVKTLINDDIKAISNDGRAHHIVAVAGYAQGQGEVIYENRSIKSGTFMGVSDNYPEVENVALQSGRFFTAEEESGLARVAILGSEAVNELFQGENPLGKTIKIKHTSYKVIGEFESRGSVAFTNQDKYIFIPLGTAQKIMLGWRHLSLIRAKIDDAANVDETIDSVKQILRQQHKLEGDAEDDFSVRNAAQAIDMLKSITDAFRFFLAAIAAISLLVGGIGIMNIMLVAVTERYREIGLRKAVGATKRNILNQFILETLVIATIGSALGIFGGAAISGIIAIVAKALGYDWSFIVSVTSILLAVVVGTLIGLVFGYYPARRAAGLDPITSLRYE